MPRIFDGINIVYHDQALVVCNKPSGLLAVPGRGPDKQDCLSGRVTRLFPDALIVHRLDMSTSGLIVMARGIAVQRVLSTAFAERKIYKRYVAEVKGEVACPENAWRLIQLPIAVDWPNRPKRIVSPLGGQACTTRVSVVSFDDFRCVTRVDLEPLTGRTHQLRVHMQAIGHPILGDALYAPADVRDAVPCLRLHATELRFAHPLSHETVHLECAASF